MSLDLDTRLELVKLYYKLGSSPGAALRAYKTVHKLHDDPFSATTISRLIAKFERTKTLHNAPKSGKPSLKKTKCVWKRRKKAVLAPGGMKGSQFEQYLWININSDYCYF